MDTIMIPLHIWLETCQFLGLGLSAGSKVSLPIGEIGPPHCELCCTGAYQGLHHALCCLTTVVDSVHQKIREECAVLAGGQKDHLGGSLKSPHGDTALLEANAAGQTCLTSW